MTTAQAPSSAQTQPNTSSAQPATGPVPPPAPASTRPADQVSADDTNQSAETLRLTLPLISKHGRGFAPVSYAIWFEYVRGTNSKLATEIDHALTQAERITAAQTCDLYERHIVDDIAQAFKTGQAKLSRVVDQVDESARMANRDGERLDAHLGSFLARGADSNQSDLGPKDVQTLVRDVAGVKARMRELHEHLEGSVGQLHQLAQELASTQQEARTDPLSGLVNRRGFEQALAAELTAAQQETYGASLVLLIIDIDHFKKVNDTYGHLVGDRVIRSVAAILNGAVMRKDLVSRFGGEEFAMILPATDLAGGLVVGERVRQAVSQANFGRSKPQNDALTVTISVGAALWQPGDLSADLIEKADKAMYHAKHSGRNQVRAWKSTSQ